jgi:hypothetical protein
MTDELRAMKALLFAVGAQPAPNARVSLRG